MASFFVAVKKGEDHMNDKTKEVIKKLEDGIKGIYNSDSYKEYLKTMGKFYNYSYGNQLLIMLQKPDATLVAGYKTWQIKFKRQVKKGEKGIYILSPCTGKRIVKDDDGNEKEETYTFFKAATVFDISQTEGEPLHDADSFIKILDGDVSNYDDLLNTLTDISPVPVYFEIILSGANGYFSRSERRIVIDRDLPGKQKIKTLVHEIAHAYLHNKKTDKSKEKKEVEAESVAFCICDALGLDTSEYSFGYVAMWSSDKNLNELKESLSDIKECVSFILQKIKDAGLITPAA